MTRAAAKSDRMVCKECSQPVVGAKDRREVVWLAVGPMHAACHAAMRGRIDRMIADALAAGTHTAAPPLHVCHGCRRWRPVWFKTLDGAELCFDCTPEGNR